ncbi:MAG: MFS transporter [Calditrichaeota bacterium]|nr:MAG: MFS transporter [Calditrichota bacterium]
MDPNKSYTRPFITIVFLFFMWGFITVMNDVLIPYLKDGFDLNYFQAGLIQFSFFGAFFIISLLYFLISLSSGDPINKLGYKNGIMVGLAICGLGCVMFYPAAQTQMYIFFLGALFILATGVTILQIAANPYAAILGKPANASSRLNLAQGVNSMGTTLAPIAGGLLIYKVFSDGTVTVDSVKIPYLIFGALFFLLVLAIKKATLPTFTNVEKVEKGAGALQYRHLKLGMIAIFCYVGSEVAIGSYLISYMGDKDVLGLPESIGSLFLAYYWGGAMIGRLMGAISLSDMANQTIKYLWMGVVAVTVFILVYLITALRFENGYLLMEFMAFDKIAPFILMIVLNFIAFTFGKSKADRSLGIFSVCIICLLLIASFGKSHIAFWAAIGTGLFNSIMWSNIFTLAIKDLGKHTTQGSSLLVMMIVGGAIIPLLMGYAADTIGIKLAFLVPILPYLYLSFYGFSGYKVVLPKTVK